MVRHFLKVAIRNIYKKGLFSVLNIAGLSIGISAFLVIVLYVFQETSFEKGFERWEDTYRIEEHFVSMGEVAWTTPNLQFFLNEIPEIEAYSRLAVDFGMEVIKDDALFKTDQTVWTDNSFFNVFDYKIIAGNPDAPLMGPGSMVITRNMAERLFGRTDVVGEQIEIKKNGVFLVAAVVENPLIKSHLDFDLLVHRQDAEAFDANGWYNIGGYTYAKLANGTSQEVFNQKLRDLNERNLYPNAFLPVTDMSFEEWQEHDNRISFMSKPISRIYLDSNLQFEIGAGGDKQTLVTLSIIALFILVIASINFMNLTTARSSGRTKEIGMRKVLGSRRWGLIIQFLSESLLITLIATIIAAGLTEVIIFQVNQQFGDAIGLSLLKYPSLLINIGIGVVLLGVISGLYPAFYLSSAKVIPLLKGMKLARVLNLNLAKGLRNGLVMVQFTLSTALIIATLFIQDQLTFLKNKDVGFDQEQVLVITNANELGNDKLAFKNELLQVPGIQSASYAQRVPGDHFNGVQSIMLDANNTLVMSTFTNDLDYYNTLGLEMSAGDWFSPDLVKTDSNIVVNEAAINSIGLEDPVGKTIGNYYTIVGVVKDFNYGSYKEPIGPAFFNYSETKGNRMVVRLDTKEMPIEEINQVWQKFAADAMDTHWLERNFEELLVKEDQMGSAVTIFTVLAIVVSCFGLFGLAAFTADQRLQEFGIRKVLGASVVDIVRVFSYDFMRVIGIAFLISIPLSIWGVNQWLQGFADRISLSVGVFILAGILAIGIAFATILFQSIKTGRLNPVDTIKNE